MTQRTWHAKEIVYQAVPYAGLARVFDNEVIAVPAGR